MSEKSDGSCDPCSGDARAVDREEIDRFLAQHGGWEVKSEDGVLKLVRVFPFETYPDAVAFADAVAELAQEAGHHPSLLLEYGKVTAWWWTHKVDGLTAADLAMAERTDGACERLCAGEHRTGN